MDEIKTFNGEKDSNAYHLLNDLLARNLQLLETVHANGNKEVINRKKESIRSIKMCTGILELKVKKLTVASKESTVFKLDSSKKSKEAKSSDALSKVLMSNRIVQIFSFLTNSVFLSNSSGSFTNSVTMDP